MRVSRFEVLNHGANHSQYFNGCSSYGFQHVVTGCGSTSKEAYNDAIEQIASWVDDTDLIPDTHDAVSGANNYNVFEEHEENEESEIWCYVSIRYDLV